MHQQSYLVRESFLESRDAAVALVEAAWRVEEVQLIEARANLLTAITLLFHRISDQSVVIPPSENREPMWLANQILKGLPLTEKAISQGAYHQAAALIKQGMETISAFEETVIGKRKDGKTPNVGNRFRGFGSAYGDLNGIAHMSHSFLQKAMTERQNYGNFTVSPMPIYMSEFSKYLYGLHVYFVFETYRMHNRLSDALYDSVGSSEETGLVELAMKALKENGVVSAVE